MREIIIEKRLHVARARNTRDHACHATGCEVRVKPAYFMCPRHWPMVPRDLQTKIWAAYAVGQEEGKAAVSPEYLQVTDEAIRAVAAKERT